MRRNPSHRPDGARDFAGSQAERWRYKLIQKRRHHRSSCRRYLLLDNFNDRKHDRSAWSKLSLHISAFPPHPSTAYIHKHFDSGGSHIHDNPLSNRRSYIATKPARGS